VSPVPELVRCPTCRRPARFAENPYRPFCSERCKLLDLGNWAAERYRIPAEPVPSEPAPPGDGDEEE
jgi:endogenous inhibitor of DNA gyrase (YacG/DUF329 family)